MSWQIEANGQVLLHTTISSTWSQRGSVLHDGTYRLAVPHRRHHRVQRCLPSPWAVEVIQEAEGDLLSSTSHMASGLGLLLIMATLFTHSFQTEESQCWQPHNAHFPSTKSHNSHCDFQYALPSPTEITQTEISFSSYSQRSTSRERWSHLPKVTYFTTVKGKDEELKYSFTLNSEFQPRCLCLKGWCFSSFMLSSISALLLMYGPNSASVGLAQNSFLWWTIL